MDSCPSRENETTVTFIAITSQEKNNRRRSRRTLLKHGTGRQSCTKQKQKLSQKWKWATAWRSASTESKSVLGSNKKQFACISALKGENNPYAFIRRDRNLPWLELHPTKEDRRYNSHNIRSRILHVGATFSYTLICKPPPANCILLTS